MSMSSQWAKARVMAAWVSGSASRNLSRVASEKTTPKPKVSSGRLRSRSTISCEGSAFFVRIAKYRLAGPPPIATIFTHRLYRSRWRSSTVRIVHSLRQEGGHDEEDRLHRRPGGGRSVLARGPRPGRPRQGRRPAVRGRRQAELQILAAQRRDRQ